jgi:hypothetical protein
MTERLTEAELEAMEAREKAAQAGPWFAHPDTDDGTDQCYGITTSPEVHGGDDVVRTDLGCYPPDMVTAEFIAHARTDMPRLLAEVRALRAEVEAARLERNRLLFEMRGYGIEIS